MGILVVLFGSANRWRVPAALFAWAMALAVAITGIEVGPASAAATPAAAPSTATKQQKVTERPDEVSAQVTARAQNSRVEDLSKRTPESRTFANPDRWNLDRGNV